MPQQVFSFSYSKNNHLLITPQEMRDGYMFGIYQFDADGNKLSDEQYEFFIKAAQKEIENHLSIKLFDEVVNESRQWVLDDWKRYGYIPTTYPVAEPLELKGYLNHTELIKYPKNWLSSNVAAQPDQLNRMIHMIPVTGSAGSISSNSLHLTLPISKYYFSSSNVPNYWHLEYFVKGFGMNEDIQKVVGKLAAVSIANILGDNPSIGAGIASRSISIDGLSQSVSSTQSATSSSLGARIQQYTKELVEDIKKLKDYYNPITWTVL